jgi:hypothetical protein
MTEAIIERDCPDCGRKEMFWTTVQLRSADEGSTVFYRCVCGFKYANPLRILSIFFSLILTDYSTGKLQTTSLDISDCINDAEIGLFFGERLYN